MSIITSDIAKLRAAVGAGMMDCKKALEEAGGDMERAAEILRKKGIVKAAKRADKIVAEGMTLARAEGDAAVIVEVNSETDFAAKSDDFKKLVEVIAAHLLAQKPPTVEEALTQKMSDGQTIAERVNGAVAVIGEKISLRRFAILAKTAADAFGVYVHMGGKISVLTTLSGTTDAELAREVGMQAAAINPKYIAREQVSADDIAKEKDVYVTQLKQQGKPDNIIEGIVKGKLNKYYGEVCLLEQPYIKDEEKTVGQFLAAKGADIKVAALVRYELGEGIERRAADFAAEVAEQMK